MTAETKKEEAEARNYHLLVTAFSQAQFVRQPWAATIPRGHVLADLLIPEYWQHVAGSLRINAHVECYWEDGTEYAELLCTSRTNASATMAVLIHKDLRGQTKIDIASEFGKYGIDYAGPANGFRILRNADNQPMKENIATEDEARDWLVAYVAGSQRQTGKTTTTKKAA